MDVLCCSLVKHREPQLVRLPRGDEDDICVVLTDFDCHLLHQQNWWEHVAETHQPAGHEGVPGSDDLLLPGISSGCISYDAKMFTCGVPQR